MILSDVISSSRSLGCPACPGLWSSKSNSADLARHPALGELPEEEQQNLLSRLDMEFTCVDLTKVCQMCLFPSFRCFLSLLVLNRHLLLSLSSWSIGDDGRMYPQDLVTLFGDILPSETHAQMISLFKPVMPPFFCFVSFSFLRLCFPSFFYIYISFFDCLIHFSLSLSDIDVTLASV